MQYNSEKFSIEITKCFQIAGMKAQDSDIFFITDIMEADCQQYKNLDFQELLNIINLGARKKLCEFFGLNVATIHSWIEFYLKSDLKKQYDKQKFVQKVELPELTESQKDEIVKKNIIATLRSDNLNVVSLPIFYDFLAEKGIIDINEGAVKYLTQAKEITKADLFRKKNDFSNKNDKDLNKEISKQILDLVNDEYVMDDVRFNAKILFMQNIDLNELEKKLK